MRTRQRHRFHRTLTAAGLVIRALHLALAYDDHRTTITIHEHMQDAMTDLEML